MSLKIYNTLSRKKEIFKPLENNLVRIYGCGPTVYWYQHIGNIRRYIFEDILIRTLLFNKYKIKHIINVTDVGHLTSNADEGEDKIEKAAKKEGKTAKEITEYYFKIFKEDLKKVNFTMPDKWTWATEHINEQIDLVKKLEEKGYTYRTSDGIYFDTSKFKNYGEMARLNIKGLQAGKRIDFGNKKNKTDFALWKFSKNPGIRQQEWNSPWGIGFPGWHIECSTMATKYLGEQFDIHTGGIDHIQVHHINEIAQSEAASGKNPWVKYWLHCNYLILKEGKMSKSSGQITRLKNLEEKNYNPLEFRYLCLLTHYRKKIEFDFKLMDSAKEAYSRLKNIIHEEKDDNKINKEYLEYFKEAINDDLNTPKALQVLWKLVRDKKAGGKIQTIKKMDEILGLDLLKIQKRELKVSKIIKELIKEREKARKEKNFKRADEIRERINKEGYIIEDIKDKTKIKKNR
jgi:cysteinyl-tRNA synthetase